MGCGMPAISCFGRLSFVFFWFPWSPSLSYFPLLPLIVLPQIILSSSLDGYDLEHAAAVLKVVTSIFVCVFVCVSIHL